MSDTLSSSGAVSRRARNGPVDLIEQVQARPCLWDRTCPTYRNRTVKDKAWCEICRALHANYDSMSPADRHEIGLMTMRKWYNIRDAFKKSHTARGAVVAAASARSYVYADHLTFLIPVFDNNATVDPIKLEPVEDNREEWLNVFEMDQVESSPPKRAKLPRLKETTEAEDNLLTTLLNLVEKEEDEDRAFFRSITPAVKSLPDEVKFVFRIRVMKLLNNMKKECVTSNIVKRSEESDTE